MGRRTSQRGPRKRWVDSKSFRLADEARYIQNKAAEHDGRGCHPRSTGPIFHRHGDAWLLDVTDQLAAPLARDGDPELIHLEETETSFYRVERSLSHPGARLHLHRS